MKDEVLEAFIKFHAGVERETGQKFKWVRAKNAGEFNAPLEAYCKLQWPKLRLEKTAPKTPPERMNRTIEKRVRCMFSHAKLPKSFWGEATKTTVDV